MLLLNEKNKKTNNIITKEVTMNYNNILIKYIDEYPYDEPIFIEEIKDYFKKIIQNDL